MKTSTQVASLLCALTLSFPLGLQASNPSEAALKNWPQWRGPLGTGASPTASPPLKWSETENIKWKIELPGSGMSTPIIWENQLFIQTAISTGKKVEAAPVKPEATPPEPAPSQRRRRGPGSRSEQPTEVLQFVLLSIDRQTGKEEWRKVARDEVPHEGHHPDHGFSSSSPVTDGEDILAYFGSRGLHCFKLNGDLKWSKDLGKMRTKNAFGEASSPALHGNTVVVNWDHEGEDFIAAFDKRNGKELWRQSRDEETSWSTPLIISHDGKPQVVTAATRRIRAYDLETGKLEWEHAGLTANTIPTPVSDKDLVFLTAGFRGNALYAIRLGGSGDLTDSPSVAWSLRKNTPYVPSPLLYEGRLFFFSHNQPIWSVYNARTGEVLVDAERLEGFSGAYASPVAANGRIYLVGRNGVSLVLKNSEKVDVLATNKLEDKIDASPALAGNELFLRGHKFLYCLSEK